MAEELQYCNSQAARRLGAGAPFSWKSSGSNLAGKLWPTMTANSISRY